MLGAIFSRRIRWLQQSVIASGLVGLLVRRKKNYFGSHAGRGERGIVNLFTGVFGVSLC